MGRVLVFGSINSDFVTYVDVIPAPGETVIGGRFQSFPGGKGANQAVAASRAGACVEMFGCIGDDWLGRESIKNLEEAGIDTRGIIVREGVHSGIAQIMVDTRGENIIAVAPGANFELTPADVKLPEQSESGNDIALFQNEIPQATTEALIQECKKRGILVVWNTAPACREKPAAATLRSVDFLICNRMELRTLVGEGDDETLATGLREWGVGRVIVTLGEKGSLAVAESSRYYQPAFPAAVVDTVGAGDCFCGVLACSLSSGAAVREALYRASAAAALSTTVKGAQKSMPTASQIDEFIAGCDAAEKPTADFGSADISGKLRPK